MKYRAWILTIDSEAWLGSAVYDSESGAWANLVFDHEEWLDESIVERADTLTDEDKSAIRDMLGEENVFFTIDPVVIDTTDLEEVA